MPTTSKKRGRRPRSWAQHRRDLARPVAAPLAAGATWPGVTEADLVPFAAQVEPYRHADGSPRWSLYLLEKALHPERFRTAKGGAPTRRRKGGAG